MISIIIPAYNEEKTIAACLESLVQQKTQYSFEVIVVDNNSTDQTATVVAQFKNRLAVSVIRAEKQGRGAARRAGFAHAKGEILLSTDADTLLPTNWVERMVTALYAKECGAVTGTCMITDCSWFTNTFFNHFQPFSMRVYRLIFGHYWLSGFSFAIHRDVYQKSGGFNESLHGQEDTDLAFRVSKLGQIQFVADLPVTFSGRRFKQGLLRGLFEYGWSFFQIVVFKQRTNRLSDVR